MKKAKRFIALLLVIVLTFTAGIGATLAYLKDTDEAKNVMTVGDIFIEQNEQQRNEEGKLETFEQNKDMLPTTNDPQWTGTVDVNGTGYKYDVQDVTNVVDKFVTVTNKGSHDAYIRTLLAFEDTEEYALTSAIHTVEGRKGLSWVGDDNGNYLVIEVNGVKYTVAWYVYEGEDYADLAEGDKVGVIAPNETTEPSLLQMYLDKTVGNEFKKLSDGKYDVLALSQGVQAAGFETAEEALNEAFGELTMANGDLIEGWFVEAFPAPQQ